MEKKVSRKDYLQSLSSFGKTEKGMAERLFFIVYLYDKLYGKIPTVQEAQVDMEEAGLGKPTITRMRASLKKDRRTVKVNDNQWRIKTAEIDQETIAEYSIHLGSKHNSFAGISADNNLAMYSLHSKIEHVAIAPFKAGLYKEAVQNALVEVIHEVKVKTGNPKDPQGKDLDGDKLMQHVFGCDNQQPLIAFNALSNSLDQAEQRGFMNLFKGIVGIRDRKAHLNFIQKDPQKAFEYLVLASLLLRLVDEHTV